MRRSVGITMTIVLVLLMLAGTSSASSITTGNTSVDMGKVVEIIDGEMVRIFFYRRSVDPPVMETVRIVGIDSEASTEAFEYATNRLLGKTVYVLVDDTYDDGSGATFAHIFVSYDRTYSEELLALGYAVVDEVYSGCDFYSDMVAAEYGAKIYEIGRWATSLSVTSDRININTASESLLTSTLDVTSAQVDSIVAYREQNVFNDIFEIMATDYDLDAEWFEENSHLLSVITNVNKASYLELRSLVPTTSGADMLVDELLYYLKFNEVTALDELEEIDAFAGYLPAVEDYLTLDDTKVLTEADKDMVNVNTVNLEDFKQVTGLATSDYKALDGLRDDGEYTITTLAELRKRGELFNKANAYIYTDTLVTMSDMNEAGEFELASLFGLTELSESERFDIAEDLMEARPFFDLNEVKVVTGSYLFEMIRPYIYVYESDIAERYNPYTTDEEDVDDLDEAYQGQYTVMTNVNTATERMLLDLNDDITESLVEDILEYRGKHPFRDNNDLYTLFKEHGKLTLYNSIAYYLAYQ